MPDLLSDSTVDNYLLLNQAFKNILNTNTLHNHSHSSVFILLFYTQPFYFGKKIKFRVSFQLCSSAFINWKNGAMFEFLTLAKEFTFAFEYWSQKILVFLLNSLLIERTALSFKNIHSTAFCCYALCCYPLSRKQAA